MTDPKTVRSYFPFGVLRRNPHIIDPANTDTIWEYYLLENVGVGLLRDDVADPRGYRGILASTWHRDSSKVWRFTLKPNLKWSDGSLITKDQVRAQFERWKKSSARHLVHLRDLESVDFDGDSDLVLTFRHPSNSGLIHELSLADAVFIHPAGLSSNWNITSGPYFVDHYSVERKELVLLKNVNCPLSEKGSAERVDLFGVSGPDQLQDLFGNVPTDIFSVGSFVFKKFYKNPKLIAEQKILGIPSNTYFFAFGDSPGTSGGLVARREFATLVSGFFKTAKVPEGLKFTTQLVPQGYAGSLPDYAGDHAKIKVLAKQTLTIVLDEELTDMSEVFDAFGQYARDRSVHLQFKYPKFGETVLPSVFARFWLFRGNQKDPAGSWSFLISGAHAALFGHRADLMPELEGATQASTDEQRARALVELHRRVLDRVYAVPFLIETPMVLTSSRVDLSLWNPFDLRLRYYDLRWK